MEAEFLEAAERVKQLPYNPSNQEKLNLYGLYKQALVGDNATPKPAFYDLTGGAKWAAWNENKGMQMEEARRRYIEYVKELFSKQK
jgi:diazepam-binding inhibitor (GABA receptor modulating acyl-CoA-binding protein)